MAALPVPDLHIPESSNTVNVSIIDTTTSIRGVDAWKFLEPSIPGHEYLATLAFAFLIEHPKLDRSMVFDLGLRKDWWNCSPFLLDRFKKGGYVLNVEKSVREILEHGGFDATKLEAIVWSHWHFDHTGSPAEFEKSTALIVGPCFKDNLLPGYPTDPNSSILESDLEGRLLIELSFESGLKIGEFNAFDCFGDGSLYFLNSPGHAHGHICALARVTVDPASFVLMGGDAWHHCGEIRPSPYMPLPDTIQPVPFTSLSSSSCPGALFEPILRDGDPAKPIYKPSTQTKVQMHLDPEQAVRTIEKLQQADVQENILMVAAHDESLLGIVEFFPKRANDFISKGWVKTARWKFLMDFAKAVGYEGEVVGRGDWSAPKEPQV
ncbi:hypothetical protein PRZ48_008580 [Zasmidium cellare]|uniref:Metallo-beta-lactamase domain-containing protein n=1 Tax=Zasmidium cellare TaxID=395010 RepID=A0ABR0EGN1_ZASCE|nr:hypothetical protein PRZ48_008580 [Zasmidium cellare]